MPRGIQEIEVPRLRDNGQDGGKVIRQAPALFTPKIYTFYSFLKEAQSNPKTILGTEELC